MTTILDNLNKVEELLKTNGLVDKITAEQLLSQTLVQVRAGWSVHAKIDPEGQIVTEKDDVDSDSGTDNGRANGAG